MPYFPVMQANEKVIMALNLLRDFLILYISVSYVLIHQVDLSVFGPEWLWEDLSLTLTSTIQNLLFQQLMLLVGSQFAVQLIKYNSAFALI